MSLPFLPCPEGLGRGSQALIKTAILGNLDGNAEQWQRSPKWGHSCLQDSKCRVGATVPCSDFLLREEPLFPQSAPWKSGFFEGFPCSHHSWLTQLGSPEALGHRSRGQLADKKSYRFFTGKPCEEIYQPTRTELAGTGSQLHLTKCGGSLLCTNPDKQQ